MAVVRTDRTPGAPKETDVRNRVYAVAPSANTGDTVTFTATDIYQETPVTSPDFATSYVNRLNDSGYLNSEFNSFDYAPIGKKVSASSFSTSETGTPAMEGLQDNGYSGVERSASFVESAPSTGIDIQSYLNKMMAAQNNAYASAMGAYGDALAAQERARREAMEQAKMGINSSSDKALREAYIQNRKARRDMPQQLSAQGISGGLSESTAASLANQYGENRNALEMARQQALAELASDYAAGRASDSAQYNAQIANLMGQQAQQDLALQQWGLEQMLEQQNNANRRVSYDQNPYFGRDLQAVMSGELSANDLYANAEQVVNQYGLDGMEYLLQYAQTPIGNNAVNAPVVNTVPNIGANGLRFPNISF